MDRAIIHAGSLVFGLLLLLAGPSPAWAQCTNCTTTTVGSDTVHTFAANGTFTPPAGVAVVQYLVVGGGAGGGGVPNGGNVGGAGGGGAGGYQAGTGFAVTPSTVYNIVVGAGGAAGVGSVSQGGTGGISSFSTITAQGGGGGASNGVSNPGENGASGGGGRISGNPGGNGIAGQGNNGGAGNNAAGGGGGAGSAGADGGGTTGGAGGNGTVNNITGANVTYAQGGTGGDYGTRAAGANGTANTGGGGGGASGGNGGNAFDGGTGGSGIVIIRYTPPLIYYSRNSGNWTGNNRWSLVGCGGASAGNVEPLAGDHAVICNGDTVTLNTSIGGAGLASLTVNAGGILNIGNNNTARTLTVAGNLSNAGVFNVDTGSNTTHTLNLAADIVNNGTFNLATDANSLASTNWIGGGTHSITGTGAMTFHDVTVDNNLTVNKGGGAITQSGTFAVNGNLTVQAGTLNLFNTVSVTGATSISGTLGITAATGTASFTGAVAINGGGTWNNSANKAVTMGGNLTNNGTFSAGTNVYTFNGAAAQSITGTNGGTTTFGNLTLNNANGLTLSGNHNVTVSTTLALTNGRATTNANVIYIASGNAVTGAGANNFVVGNLRKRFTATGNQIRQFEVGTVAGGVRYTPVSVRLGNVTGVGDFTVTSTAGDHPNIASSTLDPALSINRYWTLTNNSVTFAANANTSVDLNYVAADYDGGADFNNFYAGVYSGSAWTEITPTARSATTTTVSGTGITTANIAGDYQVAERKGAPTLVSATLICGTTTQVEVVFSIPVTAATAQNAANYALDGSAAVSAAVLGADNRVVTLTTSPLSSGRNYTLTVNNVASPSGGVIAANSQITFFSEGGYLSGLQGNYFNNMTLTGTPAGQRIDGPLNFDWGTGTPGVAGVGADNFSVRWTGFVTPSVSGNYTFRTRSDDGVRLYIDGNLVINNWTDHGPTDNDSAPIALTAGQRHTVVMEFYENGGGAVAQLSWSGPGTGGFQFIPRSALSHFCGLPTPGAIYTMDETTWNGTAGEVKDSSGNGFDGTAMNGTVPVPSQVCNGAQLNGSNRYIQVNNLSSMLNATASLAFWINTTQNGNDTGWQAPGVSGVELSGGSDDIFWGWIDATGRIGVSVANDYTTKSTVAINNGVWRHVVLTRDHVAGQYKIYIDGVLNASGAIATGVIGTGFSSIGRIEDTGGTPEYLNGRLDEVRIYGQVLTDTEVLTIRDITRPCTSSFSHIRIEHTGAGLTCEPVTVLVKACADAACTTLYPGPVTTTLSPTGWVGGDTINFTSSTSAFLRRTTPGTVTMGAGTTAPAPLSSTLCFNGLSQTCDMTFQDTGFLFSAIPTQTAATTSGTHTLRAVRKSDSSDACVSVFTGNVNIDLASQCVNPATCQAGQQVTITNNGSTAIAANPGSGVSAWTTKSMTFGANATANFTLNYPDVGQLRLHARHNIDGSGNFMTGMSNDFVVKPAGFVVTGIQRTADAFANPAAADAGGLVFIKAGEDITLTATAVNALNNATPNYGKEAVPEGVRLTNTLAPGLGLTSNPALGNGTIAGGGFTNGSATVTNVSWGEVGIINITPGVGDNDYLGAGNVTGTMTANIGRFTPHNFGVSANTPMFTTACGPGAFTYLGQRFNYAPGMEPVLTVTARNLAGGTTQNYKGTSPASQAFFKITTGSLTGKAYSAASGTLDVSTITAPDPVIVAVGNGTGTLTFNSGTGLAFTRSTPVAPFDAEISLAINVIDTDTVAYSTNPARFGQATAGNGIAFSGGKGMRFGRLRVIGGSGSQLLPLKVPFEAQYWTGTFFATNTVDTCTTVGTGNVGLGNYIGNLNAGESTVTAVSALTAGRGNITLSAPGAGNNGSVDLAINLGGGPNAAACPAFAPTAAPTDLDYLRGQWCGAAYDRDPAARARFGIRSGSDERIYMRENY